MKRNVDNMWAEADARAAQMTQIADASRVENDTPLQFELPLPPSGVKVVQGLAMTSVTFTAMAAGMATISKSSSTIWKGFQPVKNSKMKTNGLSGSKKRFYEWDHTHGHIEVYDSNKNHLGAMDPITGDMIGLPKPGRDIK